MQKKWFRHLIEGIWGLGTGIWGLAAAGPFLEALAGLFKAGFLTFFAFLGGLEFSNLRSIKMISSLKMVSLKEILILNPATTHPKKNKWPFQWICSPLGHDDDSLTRSAFECEWLWLWQIKSFGNVLILTTNKTCVWVWHECFHHWIRSWTGHAIKLIACRAPNQVKQKHYYDYLWNMKVQKQVPVNMCQCFWLWVTLQHHRYNGNLGDFGCEWFWIKNSKYKTSRRQTPAWVHLKSKTRLKALARKQ